MLQVNPKNIIPVTEARANLNQLISQTQKEKISLLTKQGRPVIAVVDLSYLEFIQDKLNQFFDEEDTLEILINNKAFIRQAQKIRKQYLKSPKKLSKLPKKYSRLIK